MGVLAAVVLLSLGPPHDIGDDTGGWRLLESAPGPVIALAYSPDGAHLAVGDGAGGVRVWGTAPVKLEATFEEHAGRVNALAYAPDGARIAVAGGHAGSGGDDGFALVRDAASGAIAFVLADDTSGPARMLLDVAWSPDGNLLATAGNDAHVRLWKGGGGELALALDVGQPSWAVAFAPDGKTLAAAAGDTVVIWNLVTRKRAATLVGHSQLVTGLCFTPDGELVSSALDHRLRVWEPATGLRRRMFEALPAPVLDFALSPDGRLVTAASDSEDFQVFDLSTKLERARLRAPYTRAAGIQEQVLSVRWSPDGRHVAWGFASGAVALYDVSAELELGQKRAQ